MNQPCISKESFDCTVVENREAGEAHGKGAIWYNFADHSQERFPEDVEHVFIMMPLTLAQAYPESADKMIEPYKSELVYIPWDVKREGRGRWSLSGTREKPTLHPSLHWIGRWHGYLKNGRMESCK